MSLKFCSDCGERYLYEHYCVNQFVKKREVKKDYSILVEEFTRMSSAANEMCENKISSTFNLNGYKVTMILERDPIVKKPFVEDLIPPPEENNI